MIFMSNKKIEGSLNPLFAILICLWMAVPFFQVRVGVLFLLLAFMAWLITTDLKWLINNLYLNLIFIMIFFVTFIPFLLVGELRYGEAGANAILISFPQFFIGIFINHYYMFYKKDYKTLGKIAFYFILFYTIGSLQTYFGLLIYPMASRQLATGLSAFSELYGRMGIGGFGFVYSGTFLLVAIVYTFIWKRNLLSLKYNILMIASMIVVFLMIFKASYATSLIIIFCGILLILLIRNKYSLMSMFLITMMSIPFMPRHVIADVLLGIANFNGGNSILKEKFTDLASIFLASSVDSQAGNRIDLYVSSLKVFLENPLFGIYGPFGDQNARLVGGHSGWLDLLAYYGLFTGIPLLIAFYANYKLQYSLFKKSKFHVYITIVYFLIFVFGLINPILYVYEIGFVLFCIVPAIPYIPYAFKANALTETNKEKSDHTSESIMASQYSPS